MPTAAPGDADITNLSLTAPTPALPVELRIVRVELKKRFQYNLFDHDPVMSSSMIFKSDVGAEFRLTAEQASRVNALWRR